MCLEHLASLSAARGLFEESGYLNANDAWSPVLSLGELKMLSNFLDSEVSFVHYLTRRSLIEAQLNYEGDEQDLLSMYLTNGFCILGQQAEGERVTIYNSDSLVRTQYTASSDRMAPATVGITLPPMWQQAISDIYHFSAGNIRHRFDIICTILNQPPPALYELQRHVWRWRRGGGGTGKNSKYSTYQVGNRQFVVASMLIGKKVPSEEELMNQARGAALNIANTITQTSEPVIDIAVFAFIKKSAEVAHDGVFFFRMAEQTVKKVI